MIQSQQVLEWMAEGETKGKREALIRLLGLKFQNVPPELLATLQATDDVNRLGQWFDQAVVAQTLNNFRQASGL
jgi:hypothetical protein